MSTPESEQQFYCKSIIEPTLGKAYDLTAVVDRKSVNSTVSAKKFLPNSAKLNTPIRKANGAMRNSISAKRHKGQAQRRQKRYHDAKVNRQ